jgi:hypothetical protein
MTNNNVLLTGVPRSGTTLACHLLNKLPDTVALHEPMKVKQFVEPENRGEINRTIKQFCDEQRTSIHDRKRAVSRNVGGAVPDNPFGARRSEAGLRQSIDSKGEILIDKELSQDFMLVVKHNSAFAALLQGLVEDFPVYALIRNPLASLSSWSSVDSGPQSGHAGAAERLNPDLKAKLAAVDDALDRQIYLLGWFYEQFSRYLPERSIIRYEDLVESGGGALSVMQPEASKLGESMESRNTNKLYNNRDMGLIGDRLLKSEGAYWEFYTRESVEHLLNELKDRPAAENSSSEDNNARKRSSKQRRVAKRERLLQQMPVGGVCAEIGVWEGDFSAEVIEVTKPSALHLIDPWKYESDETYREACYGGRKAQRQEDMDAVYGRVVERFAPQIQDGSVIVHRAPSSEAVTAFPDGFFDWIYIDGNHLYEFVKLDLELWFPKVKRGGYVTGDDYAEGRWWEGGVKKAVDEFALRIDQEPTIIGKQFILEA